MDKLEGKGEERVNFIARTGKRINMLATSSIDGTVSIWYSTLESVDYKYVRELYCSLYEGTDLLYQTCINMIAYVSIPS